MVFEVAFFLLPANRRELPNTAPVVFLLRDSGGPGCGLCSGLSVFPGLVQLLLIAAQTAFAAAGDAPQPD